MLVRSSLILQAGYDLESVSHLCNAELFQFSVPKAAQIFHRDAFFLHPLRVLFGISDIYPELAQFVTK